MDAVLKDRSVIVRTNEADGDGNDEIPRDIPKGDLISYADNTIMVEDTADPERKIKAKQEELNEMPKGPINALNPVVQAHSEDAEQRQQKKRLYEYKRREWENELASIEACIMGHETELKKIQDATHRQQEKRLCENERREWETELASIEACIMGYDTEIKKQN